MEQVIALIRLAFEHGWKLGLLSFLFSEAALLGLSKGYLPIPGIVTDWLGVGVAFGLALMIVSWANNFWTLLRDKYNALQLRRQKERDARKNLELLNEHEKKTLRQLLESKCSRIQISDGYGANYSLFDKGILVEVRRSGSRITCDFHPGIVTMRNKLRRELACMLNDRGQEGATS